MERSLPHTLLMMVARFVASDRLENPVGFFKRLRAMRLTNTKMKDAADYALSGHAALVLRIALPQLVSTRRLLDGMKNNTKLARSVVETKSTSPGILSRLVELSKTARGEDPESKAAAEHAKALIDSARDLLRDSLARATVGTDTTTPSSKVPMYDDPEGLAKKSHREAEGRSSVRADYSGPRSESQSVSSRHERRALCVRIRPAVHMGRVCYQLRLGIRSSVRGPVLQLGLVLGHEISYNNDKHV
jgi:hypothetical protein